MATETALERGTGMTLLKCATHVVADVPAAIARYQAWMDYRLVEQGEVPADLAAAWQAPASVGRPYALLQPASGEAVFLRFVEGDPVPEYVPIRSYGWAAIELCVADVEAVNTRMIESPFEVIGPPKNLDGFATVKPMQVRGADQETVYLTEILQPGPDTGLPQPRSLIDRPFIMVLACPDLRKSAQWVKDVLGLPVIDPVAIHYSMITLSFGLDEDAKTELVTARGGGQVFLELDQYPEGATERPRHPGALVPGVAITTMLYPDFARLEPHWASPPVVREGALYAGRRSGVLLTPEGALLEVIEGGDI
jgi:catechol 2,3-dioxygenase-like lactoylglutathione lyase family enzyme